MENNQVNQASQNPNPIRFWKGIAARIHSVILNLYQQQGILIGSIYLSLGIVLIFTLLMIFDTYVLHLKVETAVISSPIQPVISPVAGFISNIYVADGQLIKKNSPLVKIDNMDYEKEIGLAKVEVQDAQFNIAYFENLLANEAKRLTFYKNIGSDRISSASAKVATAKEAVQTAAKNLQRMQFLHDKHYLSEVDWDTIKNKYHHALDELKSAQAEQAIEHTSVNALGQGMYFTGDKIEGLQNDLNAQLASAQHKLLLSEEKLKIYESLENKLNIVAPYDGKVLQVLKLAGNTTDNTKPILLLEAQDAKKEIVAYLTQSEINHVSLSAKVKIYLPAINKTYQGSVIAIDRTQGFVDELKAQYRWRDLDVDRSAMVTIAIATKNQNHFNQAVFAGMPAIVYFTKKYNFL